MIPVKDNVASATRFISSMYKWMAGHKDREDLDDFNIDKDRVQMVLTEFCKDDGLQVTK